MERSRAIWRADQLSAWNEDALISALAEVGKRLERPAVLIQTKDEGVLWTSRHLGLLRQWYRAPMPSPETVAALMNKSVFYQLAMAEGWPVPSTWSASSEGELRALLDQLSYPCILKPQLKNSVFRRQSLPKAFKPRSEKELLEEYRLVAQFEPEVAISEWIEGTDENIISCRGYWDREGSPVLRFVSQKLLQWPPELGGMVAMGQAPIEWWPACVALTDRIFRLTTMNGIGSLECKRRPDGRLAILEPTVGRTPMSHEIAPINGFDIPWACYCDAAFGLRVVEPTPVAPGLKLINARFARMAAREYRARRLLTGLQVRQLFRGPTRDMVWRSSDPIPWVGEAVRHAAAMVWRAIRRWTAGPTSTASSDRAGGRTTDT